MLFRSGRGVPVDAVRARDHIARAAALGHVQARERMESMLSRGFPAPVFGDPFRGLR